MARLTEALEFSKKGRLPHALAITGAGPAPLQFAWSLAQILLCERDGGPCGECGPCLRVEKQQSEAVLFIEPEKGVIKLEASETIARFLSLQKLTKARVIVVQDAFTLNPQATNAILKLVEEPPPGTHFLFTLPEVSQLLPTLRSRLQVVRLPVPRLSLQDDPLRAPVEEFLKRCLKRDSSAVRELFEAADGRAESERAALVLQYILRDWCVDTSSIPATVNGIQDTVAMWRMARQMEVDLRSNVDRNLVFENFYQRVPHAMD